MNNLPKYVPTDEEIKSLTQEAIKRINASPEDKILLCYAVHHNKQSEPSKIESFYFTSQIKPINSQAPTYMTRALVVALLTLAPNAFTVYRDGNKWKLGARIGVVTMKNGNKFLRTDKDDVIKNNLDDIQEDYIKNIDKIQEH